MVHAGSGHTFIGVLNNQYGALGEELAQTLNQAGLPASGVDYIRQRLW